MSLAAAFVRRPSMVGIAWLLLAVAMLSGCAGGGASAGRVDRTNGLEVEFLWTQPSEGRAAFYKVTRSGEFLSAGGAKARDREPNFRTQLSDDDLTRLAGLVRATGYASRDDETGTGEVESRVRIRDAGANHSFTVRGADGSVDALRAWLAEVSMRQYRDVLRAQPEAGPRR